MCLDQAAIFCFERTRVCYHHYCATTAFEFLHRFLTEALYGVACRCPQHVYRFWNVSGRWLYSQLVAARLDLMLLT
jgi:hypothetical protein